MSIFHGAQPWTPPFESPILMNGLLLNFYHPVTTSSLNFRPFSSSSVPLSSSFIRSTSLIIEPFAWATSAPPSLRRFLVLIISWKRLPHVSLYCLYLHQFAFCISRLSHTPERYSRIRSLKCFNKPLALSSLILCTLRISLRACSAPCCTRTSSEALFFIKYWLDTRRHKSPQTAINRQMSVGLDLATSKNFNVANLGVFCHFFEILYTSNRNPQA